MNRRGFLQAAVAAFAMSTALARTALEVVHEAKRYVLAGDGKTDDSEALQAALDGADVRHPDGTPAVLGKMVLLRAASCYRITKVMNVRDGGHLDGNGATIEMVTPRKPVLSIFALRDVEISNLRLETHECRPPYRDQVGAIHLGGDFNFRGGHDL